MATNNLKSKNNKRSNNEEEVSDQNVYYKDSNGNFKPFGVCYGHNYIPDGIWYVRHTEHCSSTTNVDYLLGLYKLYDVKDLKLDELCGLHDYSDYILRSDEFQNIIRNSYTYQDLVSCILSLAFRKNREITDKLSDENLKNSEI